MSWLRNFPSASSENAGNITTGGICRYMTRFLMRGFPHAKLKKLAEILNISSIERCKPSAKYASNHSEQLQMPIEEARKLYACLYMLRSRCIDSDVERSIFGPGSTTKEENSMSGVGCQMTVYLKHDQFQALGEILTELPHAYESYKGNSYKAYFQYLERYTCPTTWTVGGNISYDWLHNDSDITSDCLVSVLLGAEALLRLLCETVPNFEILWLKCVNALKVLCLTPIADGVEESFQRILLHTWIKSRRYWRPDVWSEEPMKFNGWRLFIVGEPTPDDYATSLKVTKRLLKLHLVRSLFSENGTQPHSYLRGRVSAVQQDRTNMVSTRKDLPIIIGGTEVKAQHDSGAESGNFIDRSLASKLKLRLRNEKGDCKRFSMGNGKIVKALGRVRAVCAFAKEAQTKMKCWFYVFDELASPLIMGSRFLEKTKTLSDHVHRLEGCIPNPGILPMVNLIGSTQQAKRRLTAHIDHRYTLINADSGSDLDLMSSTYVRAHGYHLDRRRRCRKRVRLADNTIAETIGQVKATLTLEDGIMYPKTFDVLPNLTSEVLLGQFTLEEIDAFKLHRSSFVDVFAGERHLELSVLGYLGKVNEFLACKLKGVHRRNIQMQKQGELSSTISNASDLPLTLRLASLAKQQDDDLMEALQAQDLEAERLHLQNERSAASTTTRQGAHGNTSGSEPAQEDHAAPSDAGPPSTTHNTGA